MSTKLWFKKTHYSKFRLKRLLVKCLCIWLFKVIHSRMVRWVVTDRWGLAAAALRVFIGTIIQPVMLVIYSFIMLQRENDITSKRNGQTIKTLPLCTKTLLRLPFLENRNLWAEAFCQACRLFSLSPSQVHNKPWWSEDIKVRSCVEIMFCLKKIEVFDPSAVIRAWKRCCDLKY